MSDVLPGSGEAPPPGSEAPAEAASNGSPRAGEAAGEAAAEAPSVGRPRHLRATNGTSEAAAAAEEPASPSGADDKSVDGKPATSGSGRPKPNRRRWLLSWVAVVVLGAAVAVGLRLFVVQTFFVPSGSMIPTLMVGDRMLVLKVAYSVQRGAIVVFRRPPGDLSDVNQDDLVKRVIGLPGETIWSVGNAVYINGKPLSEPWLPTNDPLGPPITRQKIPAGDYFMMGDNRGDSYDSRDWGALPRSYIIGRVFLVIWRDGKPDFHVI